MTDLAEIFAELGISHYLHNFIEQGFDSWDTILDITESDFDALGVKLGHRRKLQRKIANSRGVSSDRALASPTGAGPSDGQVDEQKGGGGRGDVKDGGSGTHGAKRKYRRHPKPDEHAPERPPSAYVIFSNKMREDLKGRNLSFTEIAKLVGENWQNLSPAEKEPYEHQAFTAKERYNNELAEYKKTQNYKDYSQYLTEFKQKQNQQLMNEMDVAKRPKLEPHTSTASSGTASSGGSQHSGETMTGRNRVDSSASSKSPWNTATTQQAPVISVPPALPTLATLNKASSVPGRLSQGSPTHSSSILPGYRESMLGPGAQNWREGRREEATILQPIQRIADMSERRRSHSGPAMPDHLALAGSYQRHLRSERNSQPPPLLSTESTNQSTSSSTSNSSTYYPRTPMEPNVDRSLPIPALFSQKSGNYDGPVPYLPAPSLSPRSSILGSQHSPNGMHPTVDFPTAMPPMRRYSEAPPSLSNSVPKTESPDTRLHSYMSTVEDNELDPVSALLRAGEIVDRSSRGEPR
ncbi:hypothetical protein CJF32_00004809 [Rutstroemia sp. NJR-2017a WRK4]|nr:hypothetical protein CJF32_00004809 [Rutstroemia sp. NJR-2017a WRK4]